jgi:ATP-dependent RNA helicase DeaD
MVVLDEANEMLHMGFLEDVEWILSQIPDAVQTTLFSATMPPEIRRTARRYLHDPVTVEITPRRLTVPTIEQRYLNVSEQHKLVAYPRPADNVLRPLPFRLSGLNQPIVRSQIRFFASR